MSQLTTEEERIYSKLLEARSWIPETSKQLGFAMQSRELYKERTLRLASDPPSVFSRGIVGIYVWGTFPRPKKKKPSDGLEEIAGVHIRLGIMPNPTSHT